MKTKIFFSVAIISSLIIFFVLFKGLQNTNIYTPQVDVKKDIPYFEAKIFDSDIVKNSNEIFQKENFYLLNIWSSWCAPCRNEHPILLKLKDQVNLEIIGLNYKDNIINAKKFLKELNSPYRLILSDENGIIAIEWGAYGVPETFLIHNKRIIKRYVGPLNMNSIIEIKKLIE